MISRAEGLGSRPRAEIGAALHRGRAELPMLWVDTALPHRLVFPGLMLQRNDAPPRPRLLVLDEDRIILQSLAQFLRREGYEVRTTDRPEDAMAILESGQAELLLADVNIAGLKPAEFLRDLRRRYPHVVVVVITGYGSIGGAV